MDYLGWSVIMEDKDFAGYKSKSNGDLWFVKSTKDKNNDYDNYGVNHIALRVENQDDVDAVAKYLQKKGTKMLFSTPCHRPEFSASEKETYYQIMFESPDRVLFEIVYIGPKEFVSK